MNARPGAVLVTGGAGYVGSHAAKALSAAGRRVVVLDDLSTGRRDFLRWGAFVEGDAGDAALVERVCREHGVSAVMHFAGKIRVEESVSEPEAYSRANVLVTERLAGAAREAGVRLLVFSSSAAVYGTPDRVPIPESHPLRPTSPYGENKVEAERRLAASGLEVASLRYFNAAGADTEAGLGEAHEPETHLIPLAIRAALAGTALRVYGRDWPTPDGTCVRDYVHVLDLADAHLAALARLEAARGGGVWNLGSGHGHSVLEVASAVAAALGLEGLALVDAPRRAGDSVSLVADPTRAREDLGWTATRSSLARIVEDAVAFARAGVLRP